MKRLLYIMLFVSVACVWTSCEDFLEQPPLDQISTDDYWKTSGDIEKYILQFYPSLPKHIQAGQAMEDAESDNLLFDVQNPVLNGERTITTSAWTDDWSQIRSINIFFDNYRKVKDGFESYRHFLGEAHFFKAWFYFQLLRQYGDVPWYTTALEVGSPKLLKGRDPRTLVADSILLNIDKAIKYLDTRSVAGNSRLNKEAALAFKTRVALFEGTWQKYHKGTPYATPGVNPQKYFQACIDAAEQLMSGTGYTKGVYSTGNPGSDYYNLFGMDNMSAINEVLLYRASNYSQNLGNNVQFYTTVVTHGMSATWQLVTSYLSNKGNLYDYKTVASQYKGNDFLTKIAAECDPRLHATIWIPGDLRVAKNGSTFDKPFINQGGESLNATGFQVKKFSNPFSSAAGSAQTSGFSETGYIIFRYAEVLLNYAEAKCEVDNSVAFNQLNLLRSRAGMPNFIVHPQSSDPDITDYGYSISNELYEIRRERRVEMALEGRRPDDYRRWAAHKLFQGKRLLGYPFKQSEFPTYTPPLTSDGLIDYFKARLPNGYGFREGKDYLDDIPQVEITLNPNLSQNPGW